MKAKDLKDKKIEELKGILVEKKRELGELRIQVASNQLKEHRDYRNLKKEIARILTVINSSN
ncbi:MAG: 50S ribosomal protein L29 [Candidatus Moranbacteria bacterium]|nr:50S ribosomal protein L29 [Candidatus Moranbacteria bacterium]